MPQWDASRCFDQRATLPGVTVPARVIAVAEDVEAPPQDGEMIGQAEAVKGEYAIALKELKSCRIVE